jgi:hypothetical protein
LPHRQSKREPEVVKRGTTPAERNIAAVIAIVAALFGGVATAAADPRDLPDMKLTPGAVATENVPLVCRAGYARSVRPKGTRWRKFKDEAYDRYGLARGHRREIDAAGQWQATFAVDHLLYVLQASTTSTTQRRWTSRR